MKAYAGLSISEIRRESNKTMEKSKDRKSIAEIIRSSNINKKYILLDELADGKHPDPKLVHWASREMCRDKKASVIKAAMELLKTCWTEEDYHFLLELAAHGTVWQSFFALYYLIIMLYQLDLDDEQWEKDVFTISEKRKEKKLVFMFQACRLFLYWDKEDFQKLGAYLYNHSVDLRIWAVNIFGNALECLEESDEETIWIQELLEQKLSRGDKVRFVRILADQTYEKLMAEFRHEEYCLRDFSEEYTLSDQLEIEMQKNPDANDVLSYAVLLFYYPFLDLKKATRLLRDFGEGNALCMTLGSFYCCYYKFDGKPQENIFLTGFYRILTIWIPDYRRWLI